MKEKNRRSRLGSQKLRNQKRRATMGKHLVSFLDEIFEYTNSLENTPYACPDHVFEAIVSAVAIAKELQKGGLR